MDSETLNPYSTWSMPAGNSEPIEEGHLWYAGAKLDTKAGDVSQKDVEKATRKATGAEIVAALRTVYDPEIPVNIFDIGLVYDLLQDDDGDIEVVMTLTSPNCPVAGVLPQQVADAVAGVSGVGEVVVRLTWSPTWTMEMMSEDAKMALGML